MTVNTTNITSGPYSGNDITTDFSYDFRIEDKTQLKVFETDDAGVETLLVVDTNYTVAGIGIDTGGTLTRVAGALPTGYQWYVRSNYIDTQDTDFESQGGFFPDVHERAFDKRTFMSQQQQDQLDRAFKLSDSYSGSASAELPNPEALRYVRWNAAADALENVDGTVSSASDVSFTPTNVLSSTDVQAAINELSYSVDTEVVSIKLFGAVGDGVTDDWAAYRECLRYCSTNGFTMLIPKGVFFIGKGQGGMDLLGSLTMRGYGEESVILREEVVGTVIAPVIAYTGVTRLDAVDIQGIHFKGQYDVTGEEVSSTYISGANIDKLIIANNSFTDISYLATGFSNCNSVSMHSNTLHNIARDGLRAVSCINVNIYGNTFSRIQDDSIAVHTNVAKLPSPLINTVINIHGNTLIESQGIAILGGQNVNISGNVLLRCNARGIEVTRETVEGLNTPYAISINNNTIIDMMARVWSVDGWITLDWQPNITTTLTRAICVSGISNAFTGVQTYELNAGGHPQQPYGLVSLEDVSIADPLATTASVSIKGNTVTRTIPYGVAWSTLGFGALWAKNATPPDLVTGSEDWKIIGCCVRGNFADIDISDNSFAGLYEGVGFKATVSSNSDSYINSCKISDNRFVDIQKAAVSGYDAQRVYSTDFGELEMHRNHFDCDPFYLGVEEADATVGVGTKLRRDDGSWLVAATIALEFYNRAAFVNSSKISGSVSMKGNTFKNVSVICTDNAYAGALSLPDTLVFEDNTLHIGIGSADATFGDSNLGIGQISKFAATSNHIYYDSDIASGTYGSVQTATHASSTEPVTGYYMKGYKITRVNPSSGGWVDLIRAVTGTAHVVGTDWLRVNAA